MSIVVLFANLFLILQVATSAYVAPRDECYNITTSTTYTPYAASSASFTFPNTTSTGQCQVVATSWITTTLTSYAANSTSSTSTYSYGGTTSTVTSLLAKRSNNANTSATTASDVNSILSEFASIYSVLSQFNETLNLPTPTSGATGSLNTSVPSFTNGSGTFVSSASGNSASTVTSSVDSTSPTSTSTTNGTSLGSSTCPAFCQSCKTILYYETVTIGVAPIPTTTSSAQIIPSSTAVSLPLITLGSSIYTPTASGYIIASYTLTPGAAITVSGTMLSLGPNATQLVISAVTPTASGSSVLAPSTYYLTTAPTSSPPLPTPTSTASAGGSPAILIATTTINGPLNNPVVISPSQPIVIAGTTLTPGSPSATINETPVSLAPGSSFIVIGSSTITLAQVSTTSAAIGSIIWSGIGGTESGSGTATTTAPTSASSSAIFSAQVFTGHAPESKASNRRNLALFMSVASIGTLLI